MKYEIIAKNFSTGEDSVVKVLNEFDQIVPAMLTLMHDNPDFRYKWRTVDDSGENKVQNR